VPESTWPVFHSPPATHGRWDGTKERASRVGKDGRIAEVAGWIRMRKRQHVVRQTLFSMDVTLRVLACLGHPLCQTALLATYMRQGLQGRLLPLSCHCRAKLRCNRFRTNASFARERWLHPTIAAVDSGQTGRQAHLRQAWKRAPTRLSQSPPLERLSAASERA
jgi:hypothetical protein